MSLPSAVLFITRQRTSNHKHHEIEVNWRIEWRRSARAQVDAGLGGFGACKLQIGDVGRLLRLAADSHTRERNLTLIDIQAYRN